MSYLVLIDSGLKLSGTHRKASAGRSTYLDVRFEYVGTLESKVIITPLTGTLQANFDKISGQ